MMAEAHGLQLPPELELGERLGKNRWQSVYRASYQGEAVVVKAYTESAATWYRKKLDKNIGVYEMLQNRAYRAREELLPYTAKPIRVIGQDGSCSLCFLQEFIDGPTLEELAAEEGKVPGYLLQTGEAIARVCEEKRIKGINEFMRGARFRKQGNAWVPVMFDFRHIPTEPAKPQTGGSFLSRLGFGSRRHETTGFMKDWETVERKYRK